MACTPPPNTIRDDYFSWQGRERGNGVWRAAVFQLNPTYNPQTDQERSFRFWDTSIPGWNTSNRNFKGYMLINNANQYLRNTGLFFDSRFQDFTADGEDAGFFFPTGLTADINSSGGCDVEKQHFGVIARSRFTVPVGGEGIYIVSIGSDDGSNFRMFPPDQFNNVLDDINGRPMLHDNWFKDGSDGVFNFVYEDNIRNYYVYLNEGQTVWMNLNYYEKTGRSRLSFDFRLYVGPGEINIGNSFLKSERYCGINPDPSTFEEFGPAVFADGTVPRYEWEYSLINDPNPDNWNVIAGATDNTYDIPAFNSLTTEEYKDEFPGPLFFRRIAIDSFDERFPSNVLEISLETIADLDQDEYGDNSWIGHIYDGIGDFTSSKYLGRQYESDVDFIQNFREGPFPGHAGQVDFIPDYGCPFFVDRFSVRYKMKYTAQPGTYTAQVRGDDGFRLSIDGGATWIINDFVARAVRTLSATFEVEEETELFMVIEYFENIGDQTIQFAFSNIILPVEWGKISGNPCGDSNCLTWETIQEKNTSHFSVERSYDGSEWTPVGDEVAAQGFSTEATSYQLSDATFMRERSFYRVKQVDLDGSMDYSETIRIDNHSFRNKMLPYPNPTVDRVRFFSPEEVLMVQVTSHDARVNTRADFELIDENIYELDFSQLQSSHYVITVVTKGSKESHKIIKK